MNNEFWKNKKVLITGNTGFKGSWLSKVLLNAGATVYGYALKNECEKSIFNAIHLERYIESCYEDICNEEKVLGFVSKIKPDIVFHLAAQPIVRLSYLQPVETYRTNVMGTVNILDSIRKVSSVKAVINITTDKVYMNDDKTAYFSEDDRLGGYDPYSNSKACSELVTSSYVLSFFNPEEYGKSHNTAIATVRAGNVIGGGDYAPDRLIPDCIRAAESNQTVKLRNPDAVRPWQNVLEPVSLYITLAEKLYQDGVKYNGAWNIGPSKEDCLSVIKVINMMREYIPSLKVEVDGQSDNNMHESKLLTLNSTKIAEQLDFADKWNINDAVKYTAMWYNEQLNHGDMTAITEKIIYTYFNL